MEGLTEGRIVHFVLSNGEHRPAIVVNNWGSEKNFDGAWAYPEEDGYVNLQVFIDGSNDNDVYPVSVPPNHMVWETSIKYSAEPEPRTWHWIEKA